VWKDTKVSDGRVMLFGIHGAWFSEEEWKSPNDQTEATWGGGGRRIGGDG